MIVARIGDEITGAMKPGEVATLPQTDGQPAMMIQLLESSRPGSGTGTALMQAAYQKSLSTSAGGGLLVNSAPGAVQFYQRFSPTRNVAGGNFHYVYWSAEDAARVFGR